jgi:hypothetical protein
MNQIQESKKHVIDQFWSIYEIEGTVQALDWLESLKYYEEYCMLGNNDLEEITSKIKNFKI